MGEAAPLCKVWRILVYEKFRLFFSQKKRNEIVKNVTLT